MAKSKVKTAYAGGPAIAGWVLFDFAAQPVFTLITTFIFAPFFAAQLADSPVHGQALWGFATGAAGLVIAILSPVLGAVADAAGRRKPWIAAFSILILLGCAALWFAVPGADYAVPLAMIAFAIATIGAEFAGVFTNAMMPDLVPPEKLGRLSGTGWAMGYVGGLISLALILVFFVANPETGKTLAGFAPAFGMDALSFAGDRASGPFSALWYLVFVLPLFFFTPDAPKLEPVSRAVRSGIANLKQTIASVTSHKNVFLYLVAHMIYADGLVGLFAFGGIYATGIFGWSTTEIGAFGILLTITGSLGAFIGGRLDDRLGPKTVVMGALAGLILAGLGILSTTADSILFAIPVPPPVPGDGLFAAPAEQFYMLCGVLIGAVAGPLQAASRTLLIRVSPEDAITQFFGLYALAGKVTSFMAPTLVGIVTALLMSQRAGMAVLLAFFVLGAVLLAAVKVPRGRRA
ncbi:MFS transporter [Terrihabitans soli]|uniref:MFS transporter n=1 Tax=Terrihabitans soli TaxID=708113 RepID=A0A6S6QRI8_9HYPH|nr:MFS transporter [Terrihabitans soli]BCJ89500.1 MFS transporter [Terrihabitans soli]